MSFPNICALTGSTGYVGSVLTEALKSHMEIIPLIRRSRQNSIRWDFDSQQDISDQLRQKGVDVLVHAAWDMQANSLSKLRSTVVAGTERLYAAAVRAGVKKIIFISSISAFENCRSAYGLSKLEVEALTRVVNGIVLRPGLIYGPKSGGVFGALRKQVKKGKIIPLIGNGRAPQYLLHEATLTETVFRAIMGTLNNCIEGPITLAHPQPWPFRDLLAAIADSENRKVIFSPVPWRLLYMGLRLSEVFNLKLSVRSDSIISFVYQNPNPDFSKLTQCNIQPIPFESKQI